MKGLWVAASRQAACWGTQLYQLEELQLHASWNGKGRAAIRINKNIPNMPLKSIKRLKLSRTVTRAKPNFAWSSVRRLPSSSIKTAAPTIIIKYAQRQVANEHPKANKVQISGWYFSHITFYQVGAWHFPRERAYAELLPALSTCISEVRYLPVAS